MEVSIADDDSQHTEECGDEDLDELRALQLSLEAAGGLPAESPAAQGPRAAAARSSSCAPGGALDRVDRIELASREQPREPLMRRLVRRCWPGSGSRDGAPWEQHVELATDLHRSTQEAVRQDLRLFCDKLAGPLKQDSAELIASVRTVREACERIEAAARQASERTSKEVAGPLREVQQQLQQQQQQQRPAQGGGGGEPAPDWARKLQEELQKGLKAELQQELQAALAAGSTQPREAQDAPQHQQAPGWLLELQEQVQALRRQPEEPEEPPKWAAGLLSKLGALEAKVQQQSSLALEWHDTLLRQLEAAFADMPDAVVKQLPDVREDLRDHSIRGMEEQMLKQANQLKRLSHLLEQQVPQEPMFGSPNLMLHGRLADLQDSPVQRRSSVRRSKSGSLDFSLTPTPGGKRASKVHRHKDSDSDKRMERQPTDRRSSAEPEIVSRPRPSVSRGGGDPASRGAVGRFGELDGRHRSDSWTPGSPKGAERWEH